MPEVSPFRIAIRAEGKMINAYVAPPDTMEGAHLLGCVARAVCEADRSVFDDFQALMQRAAAALTREVLGAEPIRFDTTEAPEHERAGRA